MPGATRHQETVETGEAEHRLRPLLFGQGLSGEFDVQHVE
jgi:hypothetical protein